jgi:hypothetical protein
VTRRAASSKAGRQPRAREDGDALSRRARPAARRYLQQVHRRRRDGELERTYAHAPLSGQGMRGRARVHEGGRELYASPKWKGLHALVTRFGLHRAEVVVGTSGRRERRPRLPSDRTRRGEGNDGGYRRLRAARAEGDSRSPRVISRPRSASASPTLPTIRRAAVWSNDAARAATIRLRGIRNAQNVRARATHLAA